MEVKKLKRMHKCEEDEYIFEALLDDSLMESVPLVQVYVGKIKDRKKTSEIIVGLNRVLPIDSLQHLKRVNKDRILVCLKEGMDESDVRTLFEGLTFDLNALNELEVCEVAARAPRVRKQFDECNKWWPCNFHKNDYLEKVVSGEVFTEDEKKIYSKWMNLAVENGRRGNGCGAVVAFKDECIAVASDSTHAHPLQHAPMVAIDLVARSQGGGTWPVSLPDHHTAVPSSSDPSGPYLCTGYDIFLSLEPCIMCAMALIHSRIKRIFFLNKNHLRGALTSIAKIQAIKALNHHYEVFRVTHVKKPSSAKLL